MYCLVEKHISWNYLLFACMHTCKGICISVCMHACVHSYMYVCVYLCIYSFLMVDMQDTVGMLVGICMHTDTYIQIHV